jgi:gamma-glutamyltranspeptidase / glutathione hydrolase
VKHGVVAAGDPQSANAGAELLRSGGNAVDAAVATAFAAFVCELPLCSPLGGGAMLVELASGEAHAIDMFARAPGLGGPKPTEMDFADVEVSFGAATQVFHVGRASVAVPLALPGLLEAHRRWGSRPLAEVVAPAIALGRDGFVLGPGVGFVFEVLAPIVELTPDCRALYAFEGGALGVCGNRLCNRDLSSAFEDLARRPDWLRDLFVAFAREFGPANGGLVTERDVAEAHVDLLAPVHAKHGAWDVATMPAPSTGGRLVARGLALHEGDGAKLAFGSVDHFLAIARVQEQLLMERTRSQLGSTTHLSVIDEDGMAVSLTLTNGEGCGHVLSGTGMVANNLLGEEDIHPNGFHLDPPGAPLVTMMAPTILRQGKRRIALGSGGSNRLRNAILQVIVGLVEHGVDVETAVRAARLHLEPRAGAGVGSEAGFRAAFEDVGLAPGVADALRAKYPHAPAVFAAPNLYFGGVHAAIADADGTYSGAGDARRGGAVAIV